MKANSNKDTDHFVGAVFDNLVNAPRVVTERIKSIRTQNCLLWVCLPFLTLSFTLPAIAATSPAPQPKPGNYCPAPDILLIAAEEVASSLDLGIRSKAALINNDPVIAASDLDSVGTTLHLAASRGEAARTIMLIDTVVQAKAGEDYAQMLAWFPLLHTSLLTLPNDATVSSAEDWVGRAEDILRGDKNGDPIVPLNEARHMLACDSMDIPLQQAMQTQQKLMKQIGLSQPETKINSAYETLFDSLRSTLTYSLGGNEQ